MYAIRSYYASSQLYAFLPYSTEIWGTHLNSLLSEDVMHKEVNHYWNVLISLDNRVVRRPTGVIRSWPVKSIFERNILEDLK